ncbi:acetylornithine deacetylase [Qingshengfaniella alkalisoli]|uniref:Acetylornithine deacetylase n=1 Tax=Qingshengfaniella alkalisoli TaxID=2599296 RepID=A0A5B8J321_9RHOB|nr:acetylornithine deacetylase [Qingshengfaniella alkalisoli]QDY71148.1 acetylornithine deacetylase [Qingshengfaniella alkalisoli]
MTVAQAKPDTTHPRLTEAKAHLGDLIAFDTVSANPNRPLIDHMAVYFEDLGGVTTILPDETGEKANLIVRFGPADQPGVVLSGHTDVVPALEGNWVTPPFEMHERDGRLYGRGSCDMKGFSACLMAAAPTFAATDLKRPLYLCFSYDEEVGCLGAPAMARWLKDLPVPPVFAIIGEPSDMTLVTGQKGKIAMRATVTGTSGHSSFSPNHVNAVDYASRIIAMIQNRGRAYETDGPFDQDFTVPHATMLTTMIDGGVATNVTPDKCSFTFELRSIDESSAQSDMQAVIDHAKATLLPEMKAKSDTAHIEFDQIFAYPAMGDASDSDAFAVFRGILPEWSGKVSYGSEGGVFEVIGGIPSVIVGPGSIKQAHKADEFVEISQLNKCLNFLDALTKQVS